MGVNVSMVASERCESCHQCCGVFGDEDVAADTAGA